MTDNKDLNQRFDKLEARLDSMAMGSQFPTFQTPSSRSDEIDLRELFTVLWRGKWWIIGITFLFAVAGVFYALSLPNIYKSEALLVAADEKSDGGLSGSLGGLASLAGVSVGGGGDKTTLAMSVLKSRQFLTAFIEKYDLLVPLFAVSGWDGVHNQLIFNKKIYDVETKTWIGKGGREGAPPSMQEAYGKFREIMEINKDKETKLFTLSVEYYSPSMAKYLVDMLVKEINEEIKNKDVAEAQRSVKYLSDQLQKTSISEMQAGIYGVIEEQFKKIMFAKVRDEYVFKTVDAAIVPERKAKPAKALICILGVILGGFVGVSIVFLRYFFIRATVE